MIEYIITETDDGRFICQRPNSLGGLYPLVGHKDNCRNTAEIFQAINNDWESDPISIVMRFRNDPDNKFTN